MSAAKVEPLHLPDINSPKHQQMEQEHHGHSELVDNDTGKLTLHQGARFLDAASMVKLVQRLGKKKEKLINSPDTENISPLHYAVKSNHLDVVKLLVENGADVSNIDDDEDTPLHYVAKYRRPKEKSETKPTTNDITDVVETNAVVDFLISHIKNSEGYYEPNPNVANKYGQSPLHFAAMRGNEAVLKYLLSREDVNIEARDKQGLTPLHVACIYNQLRIANMLIAAGAYLYCLTNEDSNPLHLACAEGHAAVVSLLLRKAGSEAIQMINAPDSDGYTCLHYAVDNGYHGITKMCIEKGANVNCRTNSKLYPLHLAAAAGDTKSVKLLLKHNAKIDVQTDVQATPLHKAATYNHKGVVKELLARAVDSETLIHKRDSDGYTPFLLAAVYGHKETLEVLYDYNPEVTSATEKNDKNALHLAAEENKADALEFLLSKPEFGLKVMRVGDRYASEPLHLAAQKGCIEAAKILLDHGAGIGKNEQEETPLHLAAIHGWEKIARMIIEKYPRSINDEDEDTNTPLHRASLNGQHKTVELLIDLEADVTCRNSIQWTPLDCAASKGCVKAARVLLENDAPVDAMDKALATPLHLAAQHGHAHMVKELLEAGANASHRNDKGQNALDLAIEHNNKYCAIEIINSNQWKGALRNQHLLYHKTKNTQCKTDVTCDRETPMRKLIRKMPDVAEIVFNKCVKLPLKTSKDNTDSDKALLDNDQAEKFEVEFLYEFLEDEYSNWEDVDDTDNAYDANGKLLTDAKSYVDDGATLEKNHCLNVMVGSSREDLLAHPLVLSLLNYKWNHFVRYVYGINGLIYAVFLIFLTAYVVLSEPSYVYGNCAAAALAHQTQNSFAHVVKYFIIVLSIWHLLNELLQMYLSKLSYIGMKNLIEWVLHVSSILLVSDFSDCQKDTGFREGWQWTIGAIAIFLAWVNLLLIIQKLPTFGIYVVMFTDILKTFMQFFVVFALFIIAFGMTFYVLLQNQEPFASVQQSLIKTSVMMVGEMDYSDIFHGDQQPNYEVISYLLFFIFIIIMPIVIMNLLVGLAVDDIKAVQEKAELKRIAMQVQLVLNVERVLPEFLRRKFTRKSVKMDLNASWCSRLGNHINFAGRSTLTPESVVEALDPELNEVKQLQKAQDKLQHEMEKSLHEINNKIDGLQALSSKMDRILAMIHADRQ